jgi:phosphatidylglycerophosphate synthase
MDFGSDNASSRWTVVHSALMLSLAGLSMVTSEPQLAAVGGVTSIAALIALGAGHWTPAGGFGVANAVTALRLALIGALSAIHRHGVSASAVVVAILTLDAIDGWVARKRHTSSAFGAQFDMESDALFTLVAGLSLAASGRLGTWIVVPGLLRYLYALAIGTLPVSHGEAPPSRFGRYAFCLMGTSFAASFLPLEPIYRPLAVAATGAIVWSFARSTYWSLRGARTP